MTDGTLSIGDTVPVRVNTVSREFTVGRSGGTLLYVYGDAELSDCVPVRAFRDDDVFLVGLTTGADIRIRVDDVSRSGVSTARPKYGPVRIEMELTEGDRYRCRVTAVEDEHVEAELPRRIPRRSDIESGPLPEDPTQSLNELINNKLNDS